MTPEGISRPGAWSGGTAVLVWLAATPLTWLAVDALDSDPFSPRGTVMPVAAGTLGGAALLAIAAWRRSDVLVGVVAGAYAAWTSLVLAAALHGTPYGYGGLQGDVARLTAMATRYSTTATSTDQFVTGIPSEYPPLFPWLVGRAAVLLDRPAWTLVGGAEILLLSGGVVLAFALWCRLLPTPAALAVAALGTAGFADPRKAFEVVALWIFVPWVLASLSGLPRARGGLHWLPAGVIGGLLVLLYQGYFLFSVAGLVALAVLTWRRAEDRAGYLRHLLGTAAVALAVSSWYVLPYLHGLVTIGGQRTYDFFVSPSLTHDSLTRDPLGVSVLTELPLGPLRLAGLFALVLLRRRAWWAPPLLLLLAGAMLYRVGYLGVFVISGHTGFLHYTSRLLGAVLLVAAALAAVELAGGALGRAPAARVRPSALFADPILGLAAVTVVVAGSAASARTEWRPTADGGEDCRVDFATCAHAEPLPDGSLPRFAPEEPRVQWVPIQPVGDVVTAHLGAQARPVALTYDERFLAVLPWRGWTAVVRGASNSLQRWDERHAELDRLAAVSDPHRFAAAADANPYGPLDVYVLQERDGRWLASGGVSFDPASFAAPWFDVVEGLPAGTVVAMRTARPAEVTARPVGAG